MGSFVLPLAATPLGDRLSDSFEKATSFPKYVHELALCNNCGHTFLPLVVAPEESYGDNFFETSDSPGLSDSMQRLAHLYFGRDLQLLHPRMYLILVQTTELGCSISKIWAQKWSDAARTQEQPALIKPSANNSAE